MPPKAILFDFDGVIADTGNHHIAAWQRTLAIMGWHIADEVAVRSAEMDDREFLAEFFAQRGLTAGKIEDWVRRKQVLTVQLLKDAPRLFPGVVELVRQLEGRVRLAVVSSTWRENIEAVLGAASLAGSFDLIIGKEDVTAGKPAPTPINLHSSGSGSWPGRRSPSKIHPPAWRLPARPEFAPSPLAIAAPSANGSATLPTSRALNRPMGCCTIWGCELATNLTGPSESNERGRISRCHTAANGLHRVAREQRSHRFPTGFRFGVEHFFELGRALLVSEAVPGVVGQCDDLVFDREPVGFGALGLGFRGLAHRHENDGAETDRQRCDSEIDAHDYDPPERERVVGNHCEFVGTPISSAVPYSDERVVSSPVLNIRERITAVQTWWCLRFYCTSVIH